MALQGKRLLVIGGSSGIGLAVARQAAAAGAALLLVGRDSDKLETSAEALRSSGVAVDQWSLDASRLDALAELIAGMGPVDHLVSTVGGAMGGGFLANSEDAVRNAIEEKFFVALRIVKALSPHLRDGGSVTLTSGAGGRPHTASGAIVGNAAVRMLAEGLAVELAPRLRVNAVAPTWMDTPLWRDLPRSDVEATKAHFAEQIPLGRTATVEEVAQAYLFAMTNDFVTGQTLIVDGGLGLVS